MKLKGYYIHYDARTIIGVSKKLDMQLAELRKIADVEEICVPLKTKNVFINALAVLPFMSLAWNYSEAYAKIRDADFLYIRSVAYDYKGYRFLKWVKENNPKCKILVEIPTYSKKEDLSSLQGFVLYPKFTFNRKRISKHVNKYVTYSDDDIIYGVDTIRIMNGINVDDVKISDGELDSDKIRLVAVAMMQPGHGYERIIEGLHRYYMKHGDRNVVFNLVGEGRETPHYKELVEKYRLEERVVFHGQKDGTELDIIYDNADIAIEGLGFYKFDLKLMSSLKTREYLAKGLPMVYATQIDVLKERQFDYSLRVADDNTAVKIDDIIRFYDSIYGENDKCEVVGDIRYFAKNTIDFSKTFLPVMNYIEDSCNMHYKCGEFA